MVVALGYHKAHCPIPKHYFSHNNMKKRIQLGAQAPNKNHVLRAGEHTQMNKYDKKNTLYIYMCVSKTTYSHLQLVGSHNVAEVRGHICP